MLKKNIMVLICLFCYGITFSQEDNAKTKRGFLQLELQINQIRLKDVLLSDLNYSGTGLSQNLAYYSINKRNSHLAQISYSNAKLTNNSNVNSIDATAATLIYKYRKGLNKKVIFNSDLYVGPYLKGKGFARDKQIFIDNFSLSKKTGEWFLSMGLSALLEKQFTKKQRLMIELDLGLLSYLNGPQQAIGTQFLNKLFNYGFGLNYEFTSTKKFSFLIGYNYDLYNYSQEPNAVKYADHSLVLGTRFKLIK